MLPDLTAIETRASRLVIGATVRSTRYPNVQGAVTAIHWMGYQYSIEVAGQHSDSAASYVLLSPPTFPGFNHVNPNAQEATSGRFEILLPGEGDRIYFADTAQQAIALVAAAIGLDDPERETAYLTKLAEAGPVDERRWRGNAGIVGQLAYVSTRQAHPSPRFAVGTRVTFFNGHTTNTVRGLALYKDRLDYGQTQWHYFYAEALGNHHPMSEAHTAAAG